MQSSIISINKNIQGGTPCFSGTRVPVSSFFDHLEQGYTLDEFLGDFPTVQREQAIAVLELAKADVSKRRAVGREMKLLLDENLPHRLRSLLTGYEAFTVAYMKWSGIENGELLSLAAEHGFDALVTKDLGVRYEQNVANLPCAVVILQAKSNSMRDIEPLVPTLLSKLESLKPKSIIRIG